MMKHPTYYIPAGDRVMMERATFRPEVDPELRVLPLIVELGSVNGDSILGKTVPFLHHARRHIAVDGVSVSGDGADDVAHGVTVKRENRFPRIAQSANNRGLGEAA